MALTEFQRHICNLLATNRRAGGESYVADGVALNELLGGIRLSRDVDLFHDSDEALRATWDADRGLLESAGLQIDVLQERPGFAGRLEVRDRIDLLQCDDRLQPLGYLAWAACGKDPGFGPLGILEEAGRSGRYSAAEVIAALPSAAVGQAVLDDRGNLFRGSPDEIGQAVASKRIRFHEGAIRGVWPQVNGR